MQLYIKIICIVMLAFSVCDASAQDYQPYGSPSPQQQGQQRAIETQQDAYQQIRQKQQQQMQDKQELDQRLEGHQDITQYR